MTSGIQDENLAPSGISGPAPSFGRRIPQLDGLRGVAILLVVIAHALGGVYPHDRPIIQNSLSWGGAFVGVQLFFVLSGFLITSVLLAEHSESGAVKLFRFYTRRAKRLIPALTAACAFYGGYAFFYLLPNERDGVWGSVARAMTYTTNLKPLLPEWPDSKWLTHTWSLAVEEQFYLAWPLALVVLVRYGKRSIVVGAVTVALLTIASRHVIAEARPAHEIMYYLLRWDTLLMGCLLAVTTFEVRPWMSWAGWSILAYYSVIHGPAWGPFDYTVSGVACAFVVKSALRSSWLANRVLCWFGMISYGLYIWHLLLMRLDAPTAATVGLSIPVSYLSYRFLELPVLRFKR